MSYRRVAVAATKRNSRTMTISKTEKKAASGEIIARRENRAKSELFRETFRVNHSQRLDALPEGTRRHAATVNPEGYAEEDIPRLVKEVLAEIRAEKEGAEKLANGDRN